MEYYTNVSVWGSRILYRGVNEYGEREQRRIDYNPSLFVPSKDPTRYTTVRGEYMDKISPGNIRDCRDFVNRYKDVDNFKIYGNQRYEYCFIADTFTNDIEWDISRIRVANIDIEVGDPDGGGFPKPEDANGPLTAITVKMDGIFTTFGCGDFINDRADVKYVKCSDEYDLVKNFLGYWSSNYPDVVTGWNIQTFDIPYLVNRITKLLGEDVSKTLSPWGVVTGKTVPAGYRDISTYSLMGIATLDMIQLYRKYAPGGASQESYRLDNIAHVELGERKLSYEEYGSLLNLYKENYQKFIEYNIKDVDLVDKIDNKHKFIELALTLAYDAKCNFEDVFQQVRMWDVMCFNYLKKKNKVLPPLTKQEKDSSYDGAYVKLPIVGEHKCIASFDVNSEYPSVIMGSNISPETIVEPQEYTAAMREVISNGVTIDKLLNQKVDTSKLADDNVCLTANGQFYKRDVQGFMPEMVEKMFADRKVYKKAMLDAEQELENTTDPAERNEIKKRIAKFKNLQLSKKVCLNSLYGALGSQYFRFFDTRHAVAVTSTGQLSIRWIENSLNGFLRSKLNTTKDYVIAVDTDSVYLNLEDLIRHIYTDIEDVSQAIVRMDSVCDRVIQPVIDKACSDLGKYTNVFQQKIVMKREVLADKGIWTSKKHYILNVHNSEGVQYAKPKKKVMGLDLIKSSTPTICRSKLKDAVDVIFDDNEQAVQRFVKAFRSEYKDHPVADIASPKGINDLDKYADRNTIYGPKTPIHVRGALVYNYLVEKHNLTSKYQLIQSGDKVKYIYLREPNPALSNVIAFPQGGIPKEFGLDEYIDYNIQFEKTFVSPLETILEAIKWNSKKTASLESFFS